MEFVHEVGQYALDDNAQAPGACSVRERRAGYRAQCLAGTDEVYLVQGEQRAVLLDNCVPGLRENRHESLFVQWIKGNAHGQASD